MPLVRLVVNVVALRQLFNTHLYPRIRRGELAAQVQVSRHPSAPKASVPFCTRSQMLRYVESGEVVAIVHQYLKPDGTLGASGLPDPKYVRIGDTAYTSR